MSRKKRSANPSVIPAYLEALERLAGDLKPGTVQHVEVKHDAWCDQLAGRGPCNCRPDVSLVTPS
jgi:hypothetical protein